MSSNMLTFVGLLCLLIQSVVWAEHDAAAKYLRLREGFDGTAEAHAALAQQCSKLHLGREARAHFFAAARLATHPNDQFLLRRAAGDLRVGDNWLSPNEVRKLKQLDVERTKAWQVHGDSIVRLRSILERAAVGSRALLEKTEARQELSRLASQNMNWLITAVFINADPAASRAAVEAISPITTVEASESLARFSIDSPWGTVRELSNAALAARNPRHYVHVWIDRLRTPASVTHTELADGVSRLASVWTYETESADVRKRFMHSTSVRTEFVPRAGQVRETFSGGQPQRTNIPVIQEGRGAANIFGYVTKRERTNSELKDRELRQAFDAAASEIETDNSRIVEALAATAWREIPDDITSPGVWAWWRKYNGQAPPRSSEEKELVEVVEEDEKVIPRLPIGLSVGRVHSCFSAGTPVWTDRGLVAIETVQTGDRVFSADLDSGTVSSSTVLYRTQRQTDVKYDLTFAGETIQASASHPFWTLDSGWTPVKDLHAGQQFRTPDSAARLDRVEQLDEANPAISEPVYNLVVDETHTYFVGESMLLVHDDTIPRPRDANSITTLTVAH